MSVKVSVLTPVYNTEKFVGEAIESILNQSYKDFEYIICDDCSTDNTWNILTEFSKKDTRIKIAKNEKNLGIAGNRNKLITMASGEYIAWQDADDISMPFRIEHQLNFMESHLEVGIVGGFLQFFDENGNKDIRKYFPDDTYLRKNIFKFSPVAQPGSMIRKKCLDESGNYDLRFPPAEDLDMSFRIGSRYKFANLQEIVIRYREHLNSATYRRLKKIELSTFEIRNKYSHRYGYKMSAIDRIYNLFQFISIFILPPQLKIYIFNKLRNSRSL